VSINSSPKNELASYFPLPCKRIDTSGLQKGIILKFKTFYLKIYDTEKVESTYTIAGYLYKFQNPVFVDYVKVNDIRRYASQFREEDYLQWRILLKHTT
jgi:hypothetical protein